MTLIESDFTTLQKGDMAPSFTLRGVDEEMHTHPDGTLVLIVFMCNHCPYVIAKLNELNRIANDFRNKGVVVVGINSNAHPDYEEDSFENMQKMVANGDIQFTYLFDEDQSIARAFGATCTPDPFLFRDRKLVLHTRIADPPGTEEVQVGELYDAIAEYFEKGEINAEEKPSMGCSIKWVE